MGMFFRPQVGFWRDVPPDGNCLYKCLSEALSSPPQPVVDLPPPVDALRGLVVRSPDVVEAATRGRAQGGVGLRGWVPSRFWGDEEEVISPDGV